MSFQIENLGKIIPVFKKNIKPAYIQKIESHLIVDAHHYCYIKIHF